MNEFYYSPRIYAVCQENFNKMRLIDSSIDAVNLEQLVNYDSHKKIVRYLAYSHSEHKSLHQNFEHYFFNLLKHSPASIIVDFYIIKALDSIFVEFVRANYPEKIKALNIPDLNISQNYSALNNNPNKYHN